MTSSFINKSLFYLISICLPLSSKDNHHLLKSDVADDILVIDYCRPFDTVCMGRSSSKGSFFLVYSCFFFQIFMSPCLLTTSRWTSFKHSTSLLHNSTQTHGPPFKPLVSYMISFVLIPLLPPFSITIRLTRPTPSAGCPLSVGWVTHFLPHSPIHTKKLRENSSKYSLSLKIGSFKIVQCLPFSTFF